MLLALTFAILSGAGLATASSRCYWGQPCFPGQAELAAFNQSVGGRAVAIRPAQAVCYAGPEYNAQLCGELNANYGNNNYRADNISTYQQVNWETCGSDACQNPLLNGNPLSVLLLNGTCGQGSVPRFGVVAESPMDIVTSVTFAKKHNLKLVGRSSGKDSFVIWTHKMKGQQFSNSFVPQDCSVPGVKAMTFEAGVQFAEGYKFAHDNNVALVGGSAAEVGAAGGWLQGGGHSFLSPKYGLGVDNVLEFEIVTADGKLQTANACTNPDLFWALRGGGGGTWGVATKVTYKAQPSEPLAGVTLIAGGLSVGGDEVERLVKEFARISPALAKLFFGGVLVIEPEGFVVVGVAPGVSEDDLKAAFASFTTGLLNGSILSSGSLVSGNLIAPSFTTYPDYYDFYSKTIAVVNEPVGIGARITSRLIPNELFQGESNLTKLAAGIRQAQYAIGLEAILLPLQILISTPVNVPDTQRATSVTPAWRNSLWHAIATGGWLSGTGLGLQQAQTQLVNKANDAFRQLAPNSGAYQNEANVDEPDHEQTFWGDNINRLNQIKKQYDPDNFFAVWHGVGWEGAQDPDFQCYDKWN